MVHAFLLVLTVLSVSIFAFLFLWLCLHFSFFLWVCLSLWVCVCIHPNAYAQLLYVYISLHTWNIGVYVLAWVFTCNTFMVMWMLCSGSPTVNSTVVCLCGHVCLYICIRCADYNFGLIYGLLSGQEKGNHRILGALGVGEHGEVWPRLLIAQLAGLQISSWFNKGSQGTLYLDAEILVCWRQKNMFLKLKKVQYVEFRRCPSRTGVVQDPPWVHIFLNADIHCILSFGSRPHFRPNPYYEDLERMEEAVMSILHNLEMENTEIHENNHKLKKEITFSR